MKRYQIIRKQNAPLGDGRWSFVAHGAAYNRGEADEIASHGRERGYSVKLLPIN